MSIDQLAVERRGLCVSGRCIEPLVAVDDLAAALERENIEQFRPLLPVGYEAVASAYRSAACSLTARDLTEHYTTGVQFFHDSFVPWLKQKLNELSGGHWRLDDYVAYAAGSDVDLMTHIVEAAAARGTVCLFPGDWYGFLVGSTHQENIVWRREAAGAMACLCIPSVRNGHVADEMLSFLHSASSCLLNLNLYPTLPDEERHETSRLLAPLLQKSMLSISFSRGYGLTASQLGVMLIHRDHPLRRQYDQQWRWHTYFHNTVAAKAMMQIDFASIQAVDNRRRAWVNQWLVERGLPSVDSGSYYVKSFVVDDPLPDHLQPLIRDGVVRLCFKPSVTV